MAEGAWIDAAAIRAALAGFFSERKGEVGKFGSTVNQTFEAFVFAQVIEWYRERGHQVEVVNPQAPAKGKKTPFPNPPPATFRLKFSTRGRPDNYSFVRCTSNSGEVLQIRHQLRVATRHYRAGALPRANICLDVAVIRENSLANFGTTDQLENSELVTFGEAKHMSAFAELVAGFVGMVHEMQPERLKRTVGSKVSESKHPSPFLFVSGILWATAEGVAQTIRRRKYDLQIYSRVRLLAGGLGLPLTKPQGKSKT